MIKHGSRNAMQQENSKHGKDIKAACLELSATPNPAGDFSWQSQPDFFLEVFGGRHSQKFSAVLARRPMVLTCSSLERLAFSAFLAFSALSPGASRSNS